MCKCGGDFSDAKERGTNDTNTPRADTKHHTMCAAAAAAAAAAATDDKEAPKTGKMFEVKKWNSVALWSWDIEVDVCAICRNNIMDPCIECQTNPKDNPDECTVAWGVCNVCLFPSRTRKDHKASTPPQHTRLVCGGGTTARVPLPLHRQVAQDAPSVPDGFVVSFMRHSTAQQTSHSVRFQTQTTSNGSTSALAAEEQRADRQADTHAPGRREGMEST